MNTRVLRWTHGPGHSIRCGLLLFLFATMLTASGSPARGESRVYGPPTPVRLQSARHQPRPVFYRITGWESRTGAVTTRRVPVIQDGAAAVQRLCAFYGLSFDPASVFASSISPMEWPPVFKRSAPNPHRQRAEFENLMANNGLAFRTLITLESGALADTLADAIAGGTPVLLNAPGAPILYGYDLREPDHWWWMQRDSVREILFESERVRDYVYWSDDPAANIIWAVTGIDSVKRRYRKTVADGYEWLQTIHNSVQRNAGRGLTPYPLSLRAFRDAVAEHHELPALAAPVHSDDPLGIRRTRRAREYAVALLEHMSLMATDTLESQPMRLALYYYYNAIHALEQLDTLLYDAQPGSAIRPDVYRANWRNDVRRPQIVARMNDLLEWEKQAAQQLRELLSDDTPKPRP